MATRRRQTRQHEAILEILDETRAFRSAQQLHDLLKARGATIGIATVYRAMRALSSSGEVDALRSDDGEVLFRRCGSHSHHHHLVCRSCRATVEISGPAAENWAAQVGDSHGFSDITHTIEVFGTCASCRARDAAGGN